MNRKNINITISVILGVGILFFVIKRLGLESILLVLNNIHPIYFIPYILFTTATFFINAWRLKIVLGAYKKKANFWDLLKQNFAGYAVSYVTPSARIGGEPLKVYMLKKECDVDYKTGTSAVVMDKFVELLGSAVIGMIGLVLIFFLPNVPVNMRIILGAIMVASFGVLFFVYYWTISGKGPFTYLFNLLRFYKFKKWSKAGEAIKEIEEKMYSFFKHSKKEFFWSFMLYGAYGFATYFEFKFVLMAIGFDPTAIEIILSIVVIGVLNFVPVPAGVGFHEAGQTGLFQAMRGAGEIGLVFMIIERIRAAVFVTLGFSFISHFSGKEIIKVVENKKKNIKN